MLDGNNGRNLRRVKLNQISLSWFETQRINWGMSSIWIWSSALWFAVIALKGILIAFPSRSEQNLEYFFLYSLSFTDNKKREIYYLELEHRGGSHSFAAFICSCMQNDVAYVLLLTWVDLYTPSSFSYHQSLVVFFNAEVKTKSLEPCWSLIYQINAREFGFRTLRKKRRDKGRKRAKEKKFKNTVK